MFNLMILIFFACFNFECFCAKEYAQNKLQPKKFVIVTASYNNIDFVSKYLNSIFSQKCDERKFTFRVIYYDDCSSDKTGEVVETYKQKFKLGDKFCIVRNSVKVGAHENIYNAIHSCDDDEIILIVDGDDWLARDDVLEILCRVYSDLDVWITYGQYKKYPDGKIGACSEIPKEVIKANSFRSYKWVSSHLRTFYAWLYKRIKVEDLKYQGKFVPFGGDLAIMFPMLEMAGEHSKFIPEVLYVYNCVNVNSYLYLLKKVRGKSNSKNDYESKKAIAELKNLKSRRLAVRKYLCEELQPYLPLYKSDLMK